MMKRIRILTMTLCLGLVLVWSGPFARASDNIGGEGCSSAASEPHGAGSGPGACETLGMGQVQITPSPLRFGSVWVDTTATLALTLDNVNGTEDIAVSEITVSGEGFSVRGLTPPLTLKPGAPQSMEVVFAPPMKDRNTWYLGLVTVTSNAANSPTTASLSGKGLIYWGGFDVYPTVWIKRSNGTPAITAVFPIEFDVQFSEAVSDLDVDSIRWGGTVKATSMTALLVPRGLSSSQYTLRITDIAGMGAGGTVNPVVPAGVVGKFLAWWEGNNSSNTDAVVTYDASLFGARITTPSPAVTAASTVTYTVAFDAAVKGNNVLALVQSRLGVAGTSAGAAITAVQEAETSRTYEVLVHTGGDGTLALALDDDDTILRDSTGAPLNGAGSAVIRGPMIEVDKTSPTVLAIQRAFGARRATSETQVVFEVAFSDAVEGVDAADFAVACSDPAAGVAGVVAAGNAAYVVCNVGAALGPYQLSVIPAATMTNRAGLGYVSGTPNPNEDYYIYENVPGPTCVDSDTWTLY